MSDLPYKLAVFERGKGRPVILLHGIFSSHRYWLQTADLLEKKHRVIMPDLLGFGASPKPRDAAYSVDEFISALEHSLDLEKLKHPPLLVGHSMGATLALHWARLHPKKFSGLILTSPVFFQRSLLHQQLAGIALQGKLLAHGLTARIVTTAMGLSGLVPFRLATRLAPKWPKHIVEDATNHHYYVYKKIIKNAIYMDQMLDELGTVKLPTHVLVGEEDTAARHALGLIKQVCQKNKHCQLYVLPGGHQLPLDHPETLAKVIIDA